MTNPDPFAPMYYGIGPMHCMLESPHPQNRIFVARH